jgi:hypothetical protein
LPHARSAFVFAGIGTMLIVLAYFAKPSVDISVLMLVLNRLMIFSSIWSVAILVYARRKSESARQASETGCAR